MISNTTLKLIATSAIVAIGLFVVTSSGNRVANAVTGGADIYQSHCVSCHGADGKANTPKGRRKGATDLTKSTIGAALAIRVITNGREKMPAFRDELSKAEIAEVMAYVRQFRR